MTTLNVFGKKAGIKHKLFGMIGIISVVAVIGTIVTWINLRRQSEVMLAMKTKTQILTGFKELQGVIAEANLNAMDIIVDRDSWKVEPDRVKANQELGEWLASHRERFIGWGGTLNKSAEMESIFNKLDNAHKATDSLIHAVNTKNRNEKIYADADDAIDGGCGESGELLAKIQDEFGASYDQSQQELEGLSSQVLALVLSANVLSVLALLVIGVSITVAITRSIGQSTTNLDETAFALSDVIKGLESGEQTLSGSVSTQASAITEAVAAMSQIQSVLRKNAESLQNVIAQVREGAALSTEGQTIMNEMGISMKQLSDSNAKLSDITQIIEKIGKKTDIINNIVFKTQMLSFNASIEAARAGVHGKGFAVVASEVGRLAEISGKASSEIQELLDESKRNVSVIVSDITGRVAESSSITTDATSKFASLSESIQSIADRITGVERGAQEQSVGVDECVQSLNQIDKVSSQTNEVTRTISKLCHTLKEQNQGLGATIESTKQIVFGGTSPSSFAKMPSLTVPRPGSADPASGKSSASSNNAGVEKGDSKETLMAKVISKARKNEAQGSSSQDAKKSGNKNNAA